MESMFMEARRFDRDLSRWDVGRVTDMRSMFQNAWRFGEYTAVHRVYPKLNWCISTSNPHTNFGKGSGCESHMKDTSCGVTFKSDCGDSSSNKSKTGSTTVIIVCCVAAAVVLFLLAYFVRTRRVAAKQHHRASMPDAAKDPHEAVAEAESA